MSQNDNKFQSKGKKFGGGGKGRGKPGGGGFKKRFEGDRGGYKGGSGKRFPREGGEGRKFEGRGGRPRFEDRDSGQSRDGGGDRPFKKREWKSDGDFKPRGEGGGYKGRREGGGGFKGRDGGGDRPFKKREWKPREDGDFKPREDRGGDRPFKKREWKDRDGEGGGDRPFKKREWKDRDSGGFKGRDDRGGDRPFKKREWKPREEGDFKPRGEGGDRPFKKREWKPREDGDFKPRGDRPERGGKGRSFHHAPGQHEGRRSFGAKKGRGDFDRRPRRARDFDLDDDLMEHGDDLPIAPASAETREKLKSGRPSYGSPSSAFLYGAHAVRAALQNPKRIHQRLLVTMNGYESIREDYEAAQGAGLTLPEVMYVEAVDIERLLPRDAVHQGILLDTQPLEDVFLQDVLIAAGDNAKILVLDQVTDPHNVGAILRSAAAFGAIAVVVQKIHAPDITGTLAKSASGAVEHIPVVREVNLTRALEQLKEAGYFCIGLAEEGKATLSELHSKGKVALVLGAEGDGLRRLVSETCDALAKLPTDGPISSLNVSNAAAVALYELVRGE